MLIAVMFIFRLDSKWRKLQQVRDHVLHVKERDLSICPACKIMWEKGGT